MTWEVGLYALSTVISIMCVGISVVEPPTRLLSVSGWITAAIMWVFKLMDLVSP
jgi:hypothetical protein